ncbi:MAG: DUF2333 family protein [Syntrophobacterales bacterium]|jgi:hypothetical protein
MRRIRGLSRKSVGWCGCNRQVFGILWWKRVIVLGGFLMIISCGEESAPEPQEETSGEIVAESVAEKEKLDAEPSTGQEESSEANLIEPATTEPAKTELVTSAPDTSESAITEPVTSEPETTKPETKEQLPSAEIPGVALTQKLVELLDYELNGRFWGWRPNDLLVGRFTDNINEFQLGVLEASRYTAKTLKENLTRLDDADAYDHNLVEAVDLLMSRADKFWFPSSESQYEEALENLQEFLNNLREGKSHFYYRTENLQALMASYKDLLNNCLENLVKLEEPDGTGVSHFRADNYFYNCQGVAHGMHEMLRIVRVDFVEQLQTIDAVALMNNIVEDLERASESGPWLVTNGKDDGILANHRYNLAAPISSALHSMNTMLRQ